MRNTFDANDLLVGSREGSRKAEKTMGKETRNGMSWYRESSCESVVSVLCRRLGDAADSWSAFDFVVGP